MTRAGAGGRRPGSTRPGRAGGARSRAASPSRRPTRSDAERPGRQTALTARAAVLVLAVASVMVAVALPLKIWLAQQHDITSLTRQTKATEARLGELSAQHRRWQDPAYVEEQARQRLHYVLPGQKSYIVLGQRSTGHSAPGARQAVTAGGPWYSQFWQSVQTAGGAPGK